jgi:hypothetical protein
MGRGGTGTDRYGRDFDDPEYGMPMNSNSGNKMAGQFRRNFVAGLKEGGSYADKFNTDSSSSGSSDEDKETTVTQKVDNFTAEVAPGLSIYKEGGQSMVIPGQQGQKGLFSLGGAIGGGIKGFIGGGPAGALGGALSGGFM